MSNFELIDDYLMNRLGAEEKVRFEQQLESDSVLKSDVELQRTILEGVKKARMLELKAMLNNVPVTGGFTSGLTAGKIAATVVVTGILGTSLYFYLKPEANMTPRQTPSDETRVEPKDSSNQAIAVTPPEETTTDSKKEAKSGPAKPSQAETRKENPATEDAQPVRKIEVTDPSAELVDNASPSNTQADGKEPQLIESKIVVETKPASKKYNFNYQFDQGKLILYGPFDKSLYEILEIHGERNTIFLYYKDVYYLLDEKADTITQLTPIKDATLLKKLKDYRGN